MKTQQKDEVNNIMCIISFNITYIIPFNFVQLSFNSFCCLYISTKVCIAKKKKRRKLARHTYLPPGKVEIMSIKFRGDDVEENSALRFLGNNSQEIT